MYGVQTWRTLVLPGVPKLSRLSLAACESHVSYPRGWGLKSSGDLFCRRSKFTPPKVSAFAARNGRLFFAQLLQNKPEMRGGS